MRLLGLDGLVRLRWLILAAQVALVLIYSAGGSAMGPLAALVAVGLLSNAALAWAVDRDSEALRTAVLVLDGILYTALFAASGGASNPFALGYVLHVAIAAMALSPPGAWAITVLDGAAYAGLFAVPGDPHAAHMRSHLVGMWLAYAVSAPIVNLLVARVRTTLADADRRVAEAVRLRERTDRLASLATLAAGAAHELGTPLSTIAVVAGELERSADPDVRADGALLKSEVARCRGILEQLSSDAGAGRGEAARRVGLPELVRGALGAREGVDVVLDAGADALTATVPVGLVGQIVRRLVDNARDADPDGRIAVRVSVDGPRLVLAIEDRGAAMAPDVLARAGEPFFTTKPAGRGMGLGLYFARSVAVQLGGDVSLDSVIGRGTIARLVLPLEVA